MMSWLVAAIASAFSASGANATMTEVFGGPGGRPFSLTCNPGQYLIGFHARTGGWVDGIGLICAAYNAGTRKVGPGSRKGYTGGRGGMEQEVYCDPGEAITSIGLVHTRGNALKRQYVNTISIGCGRGGQRSRCISSGEGCGGILKRERVGLVGSDPRPLDVLTCPGGELATGIQGRSGNYVDAIGLICAPPPAAATSVGTGAQRAIRQLGKQKPAADPGIDYGGAPPQAPAKGTLVK
jgi:hypothetical protein